MSRAAAVHWGAEPAPGAAPPACDAQHAQPWSRCASARAHAPPTPPALQVRLSARHSSGVLATSGFLDFPPSAYKSEPALPGAILRRRRHADTTSATSAWRSRAAGASFSRCFSGNSVRYVGCSRGGIVRWPSAAAPFAANTPDYNPRVRPKERGPHRPGPPRGRDRGDVGVLPPP